MPEAERHRSKNRHNSQQWIHPRNINAYDDSVGIGLLRPARVHNRDIAEGITRAVKIEKAKHEVRTDKKQPEREGTDGVTR